MTVHGYAVHARHLFCIEFVPCTRDSLHCRATPHPRFGYLRPSHPSSLAGTPAEPLAIRPRQTYFVVVKFIKLAVAAFKSRPLAPTHRFTTILVRLMEWNRLDACHPGFVDFSCEPTVPLFHCGADFTSHGRRLACLSLTLSHLRSGPRRPSHTDYGSQNPTTRRC